jgi:hypothetical protein
MGIAHELITRGHNTNGDYEGPDGSVCLLGAAAYAYDGIRLDVYRALARAIAGDSWWESPDFEGIAAFSDHHSFDEVLRVAKRADEILGNA